MSWQHDDGAFRSHRPYRRERRHLAPVLNLRTSLTGQSLQPPYQELWPGHAPHCVTALPSPRGFRPQHRLAAGNFLPRLQCFRRSLPGFEQRYLLDPAPYPLSLGPEPSYARPDAFAAASSCFSPACSAGPSHPANQSKGKKAKNKPLTDGGFRRGQV